MAKHVISYYFDGDFETGISFQHVFIASIFDVDEGLRSKKSLFFKNSTFHLLGRTIVSKLRRVASHSIKRWSTLAPSLCGECETATVGLKRLPHQLHTTVSMYRCCSSWVPGVSCIHMMYHRCKDRPASLRL